MRYYSPLTRYLPLPGDVTAKLTNLIPLSNPLALCKLAAVVTITRLTLALTPADTRLYPTG